MKPFLFVASIVFLITSSAFGQSSSVARQTTEEELRNLVRTWDAADVKGDTAVLNRLLADEFAFVGGPTKADYLASFKTKSDSYVESAVSKNVTVQIYGNTAVVTGLDTITGKNKGQTYTNRWLFMDVWVKQSGRWQCVKTYSTLAKN